MSPDAGEPGASAMEALYPFLYTGASDLADLMAEVRASTLAKTKELGGSVVVRPIQVLNM